MTDHLPITPGKIIEQLQITPITLRRWCGYHKARLSTGANPGAGVTRTFTGRDLAVLTHVRSLRDQGLNTEQINEQLERITFAEIETEANGEENALESSQNEPDGPGTILAPIVALDDLQTRVALLERSAIEAKQSQREYIQGVAVGFIGAAVFFLILLLLISIYHR